MAAKLNHSGVNQALKEIIALEHEVDYCLAEQHWLNRRANIPMRMTSTQA